MPKKMERTSDIYLRLLMKENELITLQLLIRQWEELFKGIPFEQNNATLNSVVDRSLDFYEHMKNKETDVINNLSRIKKRLEKNLAGISAIPRKRSVGNGG